MIKKKKKRDAALLVASRYQIQIDTALIAMKILEGKKILK
jgi:hypothetical protein